MRSIRYWKKYSKITSKCIFNIVLDIGKETNILALKLWTKNGINCFERLFWSLIVGALLTWAFKLTEVQKIRFEKSPTVMSVERDFSSDGIGQMPALTICFDPPLNEAAFDKFIFQKWNATSADSEYLYYNSFLNSVLNTRATDYQFISTFANDEVFDDVDLYELVKEFQTNISQISSNFHTNLRAYMTEKGLCYLMNSALIPSEKSDKNQQQPQYILELNIENNVGNINVHSTYEIPGIDTIVIQFKESQDIKAIFKVVETVASDDLRKLTVKQRKCLFPNEGTSYSKIYSQNICLAHCRAKLALKLCQCIPYFYENLEKSNCTTKDFECLKGHDWPTWSLSACNCPSLCTEINFILQKVNKKNRIDDSTTRIQLEIIPPKVRKRRSVVFGFGDLLVSFGGVWTLLLGFSLVTIIQIFSVAAFHLLNNLLYLCMS